MAIVCLDYGHGGVDPGAVYRGRKEKDDNLEIGKMVFKKLKDNGVNVDETRTRDSSISLNARASFEKKKAYDYFISFHRNAYRPEKARGVETYIYKNGSEKAKTLASSIQKKLVTIGFIDRGLKRSNFYVLRETKSPAILIEIGFIDNSQDNEIFTRKKNEIADSIAASILSALGLKEKNKSEEKRELKKESGKGIYYRVMAGSFSSKTNAEIRKKDIERAGFESTIITYKK